jgi:hypothetical protein
MSVLAGSDTGSLHEATRDLSYSDIQCQRCNELGGRLRIQTNGTRRF